jgi:hypothetical protein
MNCSKFEWVHVLRMSYYSEFDYNSLASTTLLKICLASAALLIVT